MSTEKFNHKEDGFKLPDSLLAENAVRLKQITSMPREKKSSWVNRRGTLVLWSTLTGMAASISLVILINTSSNQHDPLANLDQDTIDWYFTSGYGEVSFEEVSVLPIEGEAFLPNSTEINLDWTELSDADIHLILEES